MANFGENFRGHQVSTLCPLCHSHPDSQKMGFDNCSVLRETVKISGNYSEIFKQSVPRELVDILVKIDKYREENISLSQNEANSTRQQNSSMGASDSHVDYQNSLYINNRNGFSRDLNDKIVS